MEKAPKNIKKGYQIELVSSMLDSFFIKILLTSLFQTTVVQCGVQQNQVFLVLLLIQDVVHIANILLYSISIYRFYQVCIFRHSCLNSVSHSNNSHSCSNL